MTLPAPPPTDLVPAAAPPPARRAPAVLPACHRPAVEPDPSDAQVEPRRPTVRRMCSVPIGRPAPRRAPQPAPAAPRATFPDPAPAVAAALRTALEVLDRRRPATQLEPLFSARARRYWLAERDRATGPARLVRLRLDASAADVGGGVEVAAVCALGPRVRAVAARFDPYRGRWRCTTVRLL